MENIEIFDLTIIGGGPAGLYSAFYGGLREMKTKIIEAQPDLGGKIHVYPEKVIWDVGGIGPITGANLIKQLKEQAMTFNPEVVVNEKIESISKDQDLFLLKGASGEIHYSKSVIVAIGSGILKPQKLNLEGAEKFEVSNLHYMVNSLKYFKDRTVVISGGGNSAIDWANALEPVAKKIYLVHRRDCFSGHESQVTQLMNSSVECVFHSSITNLIADQSRSSIGYVEITNQNSGEVHRLSVDDVLVNHGFDQDASLLKNSEMEPKLIDDFYIDGTATSETSVPGLFAAGDILKHEGKLNLIAGTFQDAANAVNKAKQFIEPAASQAAMVSSHNKVFSERNKEMILELIK
ncbi:NAD(P)/FAD-dependent oxidoreductase [Mesobacillus selenatarsenatis]|uniref:Ferredoxin--NADP reductase n=1 Tax=Mesobacillus selenatarsenatis (strain DSM 18680 / JCM 14380 / FERM P-15431 / SF-1) TaxID=1321606 RepID=A0A0A8WZM3_MESS1|nr:NAD(P)/FAD-dependent oxidoreductase [Mesobacillus selenatarsenatis]GAM12389.1 thioredoxin reductase [Mesobacillus selenatarsenatis SF-1]